MAPVKKRNRKEYADTVRLRLKKLADSVQEIRSELPGDALDSVNVPAAKEPAKQPGKGSGSIWIGAVGILLGILVCFILIRKWKVRR